MLKSVGHPASVCHTFDISQKMRENRNQTRIVEVITSLKCSCMRYHHTHVYRM